MYNFADFKKWLEANPERKEGLEWYFYLQDFENREQFQKFLQAIQNPTTGQPYSDSGSRPYLRIFKKWMSEADQANLEKFKGWLEARPKRKDEDELDCWEDFFDLARKQIKRGMTLWELVSDGNQLSNSGFSCGYALLVEKWIAETDQQEQARELTTQKDLNQKLQQDNKDLLHDIQNYKQKITNLETQQLTDNEKEIITKLEELFAVERGDIKALQDELDEYEELDLNDCPHLFNIPSEIGVWIKDNIKDVKKIRQAITLIKENLTNPEGEKAPPNSSQSRKKWRGRGGFSRFNRLGGIF